jgi:DtxR family Mn-dependent transcriptional regulator
VPNTGIRHLSKSVEDYLKAIWLNARDGPVSNSTVAMSLGVSRSSVTGMLSKLSDLGLVSYKRYHGAQLTPGGEKQALQLLRRHRLVETFLIEHFGYGWDEVHSEAEVLEHAVSDRFTERLAIRLGHPTHDPHGDPIPNADGTLPDTPNTPLAEVDIGGTLRVSRLLTQDADLLTYLANLGIRPGQGVKVHQHEPLGGLLHITVKGEKTVISKELATLVRGEVRA